MSTPSTVVTETTPVRPAVLASSAAAEYIGVSIGHLANLRARGEGPAYLRLSDSPRSAVVYRIADLDAWLASRTRVVPAGGAA